MRASISSIDADEHQHQCAVIQFMDMQGHPYNKIYAIPNGGLRDVRVAKKLKAEGVRPGVPDLHWPISKGKFLTLYIEMKTKSGRATKDQLDWKEFLESQGHAYALCRGVDSAIKAINHYNTGKFKNHTKYWGEK